ncbi:MAG: phospholipase D-like domain-containing protein [Candidatus Woesearchaeota archaeon]|nr:phospholipase D-like domain-containing protein [Candidatus Woesearchaeota archaeon]
MGRTKRRAIITLILIAVLYLVYSNQDSIKSAAESITGNAINNFDSANIPKELSTDPIILFCPRDDCGENLVYLINNSNTVHCAFFDLDIPEVIEALQRKNASVVVDADNINSSKGKITNLKKDNRKAYMHNKFCIFDNKIIMTGSFNPTFNDNKRNNNNVVIISSEYLAKNYEDEFQELWNGQFGKGSKVANPIIMLNTTDRNIMIENYFCPEDWCANRVVDAINKANKSVYFMTFSFTHDKIGDALIEKHKQGIEVKGIFEKSQISQYSELERLKNAGINATTDTNPYMLHHKVFIIDDSIVVTGSFNPSKNGDLDNDENILIIHNPKIAHAYTAEFRLLSP